MQINFVAGFLQFVFILDGGEPVYRAPDPILKGRLFFAFVAPGEVTPDAAYVLVQSPLDQNISSLVMQNFMVRSRVDGGMFNRVWSPDSRPCRSL